jgi:hypothetical protein
MFLFVFIDALIRIIILTFSCGQVTEEVKRLWYLKLVIYLSSFLKAESIAEAASCAINSEMDKATNHEVCVYSLDI